MNIRLCSQRSLGCVARKNGRGTLATVYGRYLNASTMVMKTNGVSVSSGMSIKIEFHF